VDDPIIVRFRWTPEELIAARRFHFRQAFRRPFRIGLNVCMATITVVGLLDLAPDRTPRVGLPLIAMGVYWFALRPVLRAWLMRREIRRRPDFGRMAEYQFFPDQIHSLSDIGSSEREWKAIMKIVRTPQGYLMYPIPNIFEWLPRHAFASELDFERFGELARARVAQYKSVT
jgi:hypothetical protein